MSNPLIDELEELGAIPHIEIALPTMAYFYPKGEVISEAADPANISIGPLSLLEESSISDPMMMVSGRAIVKLVKRIAPVVTDPQSLCEIDIQAMLIACRMASYGNELILEHVCPECEHNNSMKIDLTEHIQRFNTFTPDELAEFDVVLPTVGQTLRLKPISYEDSINMTMGGIRASINSEELQSVPDQDVLTTKYIEEYRKHFEQSLSTNLETLISTIYYVTTKKGKIITNRDIIKEWFVELPLTDIKHITSRIKLINEKIQDRSKVEYECPECKKTTTLYVELDPQKLFMLGEDSGAKMNSSDKSSSTEKNTKKASKASGRLS